jgi:hypothetical protein
LSALCAAAVLITALLAMFLIPAAIEVRAFKKTGIPWDNWPND